MEWKQIAYAIFFWIYHMYLFEVLQKLFPEFHVFWNRPECSKWNCFDHKKSIEQFFIVWIFLYTKDHNSLLNGQRWLYFSVKNSQILMQILDIYSTCFTFLPLRGDVKEAAVLTWLSDE